MKNTLVVPTIRENCIRDFIRSWHGKFDEVIIVEDNPTRTFDIARAIHYSWKEIDEELGDKSWVISRRDSAIRCFGFYMAYKRGADYIFTLDDDCYSIPEEDFVCSHINQIENTPRWTESVIGMRTRGMPYYNKGTLDSIVANVGLWTNVPDLDAAQSLIAPIKDFQPPNINRIIPTGQYFPMCGMNMCFKSKITPLMYFPLMGEGYPYKRFDDIWCGVIMKKICDYFGLHVSCGHPFVQHIRASDPIKNLVKEAPGVELNETFWEIVDNIKLNGTTINGCLKQLGILLQDNQHDYIKKVGKAIGIWASLF